MCLFEACHNKGLTLGSAPLHTDGWQHSLCPPLMPPPSPISTFPRQTAMCKCLSIPSLPMTSIDFLWGGAGAIHQEAWHLLAQSVNQETGVEGSGCGWISDYVFFGKVMLSEFGQGDGATGNSSYCFADRKVYLSLFNIWYQDWSHVNNIALMHLAGLWILIYLAQTLWAAGGQGRLVIPPG